MLSHLRAQDHRIRVDPEALSRSALERSLEVFKACFEAMTMLSLSTDRAYWNEGSRKHTLLCAYNALPEYAKIEISTALAREEFIPRMDAHFKESLDRAVAREEFMEAEVDDMNRLNPLLLTLLEMLVRVANRGCLLTKKRAAKGQLFVTEALANAGSMSELEIHDFLEREWWWTSSAASQVTKLMGKQGPLTDTRGHWNYRSFVRGEERGRYDDLVMRAEFLLLEARSNFAEYSMQLREPDSPWERLTSATALAYVPLYARCAFLDAAIGGKLGLSDPACAPLRKEYEDCVTTGKLPGLSVSSPNEETRYVWDSFATHAHAVDPRFAQGFLTACEEDMKWALAAHEQKEVLQLWGWSEPAACEAVERRLSRSPYAATPGSTHATTALRAALASVDCTRRGPPVPELPAGVVRALIACAMHSAPRWAADAWTSAFGTKLPMLPPPLNEPEDGGWPVRCVFLQETHAHLDRKAQAMRILLLGRGVIEWWPIRQAQRSRASARAEAVRLAYSSRQRMYEHLARMGGERWRAQKHRGSEEESNAEAADRASRGERALRDLEEEQEVLAQEELRVLQVLVLRGFMGFEKEDAEAGHAMAEGYVDTLSALRFQPSDLTAARPEALQSGQSVLRLLNLVCLLPEYSRILFCDSFSGDHSLFPFRDEVVKDVVLQLDKDKAGEAWETPEDEDAWVVAEQFLRVRCPSPGGIHLPKMRVFLSEHRAGLELVQYVVRSTNYVGHESEEIARNFIRAAYLDFVNEQQPIVEFEDGSSLRAAGKASAKAVALQVFKHKKCYDLLKQQGFRERLAIELSAELYPAIPTRKKVYH